MCAFKERPELPVSNEFLRVISIGSGVDNNECDFKAACKCALHHRLPAHSPHGLPPLRYPLLILLGYDITIYGITQPLFMKMYRWDDAEHLAQQSTFALPTSQMVGDNDHLGSCRRLCHRPSLSSTCTPSLTPDGARQTRCVVYSRCYYYCGDFVCKVGILRRCLSFTRPDLIIRTRRLYTLGLGGFCWGRQRDSTRA